MIRPLRRRRGAVVVLFVLGLFVLLALAALVVDFGAARWTQAQMTGATDAAALAGLEEGREAAQNNVRWRFDDDLDPDNGDPLRLGAGHAIQYERREVAAGLIVSTSIVDDPMLELNDDNLAEGDFVVGNYDPLEAHQEVAEGERPDFEVREDGDAFLARFRRLPDPDGGLSVAGVRSNFGSMPFLFGELPLVHRTVRERGIPLRTTSIARWSRVHGVGRADNGSNRPGVAPVALLVNHWNGGGTITMNAAQAGDLILTAASQPASVGQILAAAVPTPEAFPVSLGAAYVPLYAMVEQPGGQRAVIVGFGLASVSRPADQPLAFGVPVTIVKAGSQRAQTNATVALVAEFEADLTEEDAQESYWTAYRSLRDTLLAPALVASESY